MWYFFRTYTAIKRYYNNMYWIDNRIVRDIAIESESLEKALYRYKEFVEKEYDIFISKNAMKKKNKMYLDDMYFNDTYLDDNSGNSKQIGFVFTGKTDIENKMVYLDLWVEIYISVFA